MSKISSYAQLAAALIAGGDLLPIVDIDDPTMAATGTTKAVTSASLAAASIGLMYLGGGGTITAATITNAQSAGFQGLFLDPRFVWDASGLVINGVQNFTIQSRMAGSIGFGANIAYNTGGYIKTDTGSPADGIQVYASSPSGSTGTQGVTFKNCVLVGANPNAVIHFGGGQRSCGLVDTLVYNTLSASTTVAAGSNGVAVSTFTGTQSLSVASAASFPAAGTLFVTTSTGTAQITYSTTGTGLLKNCTLVSGTGNLATGGSVQLATFAVINDTALSANNGEDNIFSFTGGGGMAGAFAALGIGIADTSGSANDTWYYGLRTSGGQYSIVKFSAGNHTFKEWYDRSNAAVASVWHHGGGRMTFYGGEHQNTTGLAHLIDGTNTQTVLETLMITQSGAATTTCQVSSGSLIFRGACGFNGAQTIAVSGTGIVDMSDPATGASPATISGSSGTLLLAGNYGGAGSSPVLTSWTGGTALQGPSIVKATSGSVITTTTTQSWTPPPANTRFRVSLLVRPTVVGTSTVPAISFNEFSGGAKSFSLPMWQGNGAATAPSYTCAATDSFYCTIESMTDSSGTPVTVTITPTGSTYRYSLVIERLT